MDQPKRINNLSGLVFIGLLLILLAFKEQSDIFDTKMSIKSVSNKLDLIQVNLKSELSQQAKIEVQDASRKAQAKFSDFIQNKMNEVEAESKQTNEQSH